MSDVETPPAGDGDDGVVPPSGDQLTAAGGGGIEPIEIQQEMERSFLDYAIPVADRVPEIETLIVELPAPDGPFGAKGIGEAPVVAAPAAIANAVTAATNVRLYELPMTPPRVWAALAGADGGMSA